MRALIGATLRAHSISVFKINIEINKQYKKFIGVQNPLQQRYIAIPEGSKNLVNFTLMQDSSGLILLSVLMFIMWEAIHKIIETSNGFVL